MKRLRTSAVGSSSAGFTLLEVLVAVLLLSIGLLGLASLQAWGLRATGNATYRSQATVLANEMVERIRANQPGAREGHYNGNSQNCNAVERCYGTASCTAGQLAAADYYAVMCGNGPADGAGVDDMLPQGRLSLTCPDAGVPCTVTITWSELADRGDVPDARESALQLVFVP